jgi:hypothetical protein
MAKAAVLPALQFLNQLAADTNGSLSGGPPVTPVTALPEVPEFNGRTQGVLDIGTAQIQLKSGPMSEVVPRLPMPGRNNAIDTHVEAQAAQIIRSTGTNQAILWLNRQPCPGTGGVLIIFQICYRRGLYCMCLRPAVTTNRSLGFPTRQNTLVGKKRHSPISPLSMV